MILHTSGETLALIKSMRALPSTSVESWFHPEHSHTYWVISGTQGSFDSVQNELITSEQQEKERKKKKKKSKDYEVAGKARGCLDHVICTEWNCKAGFNFWKPYFRIKQIQGIYLSPWTWTRKVKILGGICLYGQYFKTGTRWQTISGLW